MNKPVAEILVDIIRTYMGLSNNQIWIYNQQRKIPTNQLSVIVQFANSKSYAINPEYIEIPDPNNIGQTILSEQITSYRREEYQVDILAYDQQDNTKAFLPNEALNRKEEIEQACISTYSQQQQELYSFQIARISPNAIDTSTLEGPAMLKRYTISIIVIAWYQKTLSIPFYDTFPAPEIIFEP